MGALADIMRMRKTTVTGLIDVSADDDLSTAMFIGDHVGPVEAIVDTWDQSTITWFGSDDNVTYQPVFTHDGSSFAASATPAAADAGSGFRYGFTKAEQVMLAGPKYLKMGTGTGQGADVAVTLKLMPIAG